MYSPLAPDAVRLFRFTPSATAQDLECELAVFPLTQAPKFNALSYCWGDSVRSASIRSNEDKMMITRVLREALQRLLVLDRGGIEWLWIDQICINQTNAQERGSQVDMMKAIYKASERTIIWLGADIPGIEAVETLLEKMTYLYNKDLSPSGSRKRRRYTIDEYKAANLPPPEHLSWGAFGEILSRPWFCRSWVIQEATFSRVSPRMLCGSYELPWRQILSSGTWLLSMCYRLTPLGSKSEIVLVLRSLKLFSELGQVGLPWDATTLLNKAIRFQTSEPRDRIYSLVGLTAEAYETSVLPSVFRANYDRPVRAIFRDVTRYIITASGNLSILTLIRNTPDWGKYPSWVVDFAADVLWERISYFAWSDHAKGWHSVREISNYASGRLPVAVQHSLSDDILALKGIRVDAVDAVCEVMSSSALNSFGPQVLLAWKAACQRLSSRYTTTEALARAVMVTLTADWNLSNYERVADQPLRYFYAYMWRAYYRLQEETMSTRYQVDIEEEYISHLPKAIPDNTADANIYRLHLDAAHHRRVFFTRDMLYVGLGPGIMQENDILCVLNGAATPMVLRPDKGLYRYVGECYVYNLMHGEAIADLQKGKYTEETFSLA
ncbi:heterokaryon incompatibility protein-domain-containing protein [Xylaria acuta]|nr:heterokaryon incompatibility protein-domain-containing protein [Xylaria acuta]